MSGKRLLTEICGIDLDVARERNGSVGALLLGAWRRTL
jgi:hypothetical protein